MKFARTLMNRREISVLRHLNDAVNTKSGCLIGIIQFWNGNECLNIFIGFSFNGGWAFSEPFSFKYFERRFFMEVNHVHLHA